MMMPWLISVLFAVAFWGLGYVILQALASSAEAYSGAYSEDTARAFEDIFLFISPRRVAEAGWAAGLVFFLLGFTMAGSFSSGGGIAVGLVAGSVAGALALHSPRWLVELLKRRRRHRFNLQLVNALVSMSNALKAGFSIAQAFESITRERQNPISQEFALFLQQTRVGVSFSQALENLENRIESRDLTLVVRSIESARRSGGNLTEIFDRMAATIRERMRIENRIRTLTAQGRLQGIVVGAMPIAIGVALLLVDPELMTPFLHSPAGIAVIAVMALLVLGGALIIRKIVKIDV